MVPLYSRFAIPTFFSEGLPTKGSLMCRSHFGAARWRSGEGDKTIETNYNHLFSLIYGTSLLRQHIRTVDREVLLQYDV